MSRPLEARAFAPASVGNVAVGFDVLGHAVGALGDHVAVRRVPERRVRIAAVEGADAPVPLETERNTAGMALEAMRRELGLPFGFEARVEKGIPLSAGLGGSAASAVAAVVAANALLDAPLPTEALLAFAVQGEAVASGSTHADNVAPSLFGGLVLVLGGDAPRAVRVPVPPGVRCVLAHPHVRVDTREARRILSPSVDRRAFVAQSANLAGFLAGCYSGDLGLIGACLADVVIEPQRRSLVPGFDRVKAAALGAGALGCSISGAGPTLFAWCDAPRAEAVRAAMAAAFEGAVPGVDTWVSAVEPEGARVVRPHALSSPSRSPPPSPARRSPAPRPRAAGPRTPPAPPRHQAPMRYLSTRAASPPCRVGEAIARGLAPDGGLYVPEALPRAAPDRAAPPPLAAFARPFLAPFFEGDPLAAELGAICDEAFDFDTPLVPVERAADRLSVLELFHGPTCAFKDVGARFLAACLARQPRSRPLTVLVATSGDTGGAVAAAFYGRPGVRVVVLYPKGLVSARQRQQLACWGGNVTTLAVRGTFDDCQRMVKGAFADPALRARLELSSANSINVGRLLPQAAYYARAAREVFAREGLRPSFVIPAGNLGNALACVWARAAGAPVGDVALATNANAVVPDFWRTGRYEPRPSVPTLASAMDVGDPSNLERLRHLAPTPAALAAEASAESVDDAAIRARIGRDARELGFVWCPHTAAAAEAYARLPAARRAATRWVLVATAHPAKFETVVEPLVGRALEVPEPLARLLDRAPVEREVGAGLDELRDALAAAD